MQAELEKGAEHMLEQARRAVPDDVIAHTVQRSGHAGPEIVRELVSVPDENTPPG